MYWCVNKGELYMICIYTKIEFFKNDSKTCYRSLVVCMMRGTNVLRTHEDNIKTAKVGLERFHCDYAFIYDNISEEERNKELSKIMKPTHVLYNGHIISFEEYLEEIANK